MEIVPDPFRDAITLVSGGKEPPHYVRGYSSSDLSEVEVGWLQEWLLNEGSPSSCDWSTGIGLLEAAELIVREALANGNIQPPDTYIEYVDLGSRIRAESLIEPMKDDEEEFDNE